MAIGSGTMASIRNGKREAGCGRKQIEKAN